MVKNFFKEIISIQYLKEYIHRNKLLIVIAALIFILSALIGVFISDLINEYMMEILKEMVNSIPPNISVTEEAGYLFTNNITANFWILLGGILFSVMSVLIILVNGIVLGFTYTLINPIQFVVGIFPHGIFELTATTLSLVGAFIITKLEIKLISALLEHRFNEELRNSGILVKDIVLTFLITFILLVIAAIIEAGITPTLLGFVS